MTSRSIKVIPPEAIELLLFEFAISLG